ncbi:flagellar biosynthetic protein FliR [Porticoccaceae bacterium]|jgi:flagellar biosynthetic protein FliR|nr:flagellar biosynthetic protein FliR [Porticoccus sp.]MDB2401207.1 flagellar biosynthetic protein FliR [Porticoccaceae bacterium]MDC0172652.1 flagellar biosynthetic protein FliR [Gammaproteobacteria bacterium]MDB3884814.1 flagellar biosynthetic protein FliR [Porticoccaceae bacterium]MDC3199576.1 flagellar biosynthetic protein FliR [Porticoccaceae bacterium]|tara:strand:- start:3733 stop:4503 length:771 start_codon:yes stop_codon:yes gene_type:complete
MEILVAEVVDLFYSLIWPMIRISAFLLTAPFFSIRAVSVRIRVLLAVLLTWMVYPLTDWPLLDPFSAIGLREAFLQVFIGALMGLLLQIVNAALIIGGQAISASMGLSMANMVDPNMGNVPVIAQFLIICSTLIFVGLGGHVIVISLLLESFQVLPIGQMVQVKSLMALTIEWSSMMFLGAVMIGLPLMSSLLFINIGLGVITRAAPALNIFAVGFPAMILAGIVLLSLSMTSIGFRIQWLWQQSFDTMGQALGLR